MMKRMVSLLAVLAASTILVAPVSVKGTSNGDSAEIASLTANDFKTPETLSIPAGLTVPTYWLDSFFPDRTDDAATLEQKGANGYFVWQSYVAGLNPLLANSKLTARLSFLDDVAFISWKPNLNEDPGSRLYRVEGKALLTDMDWHYPAREEDRFFRVSVDMPNSTDVSDVPGPIIPPERSGGVQLWKDGPYWAPANVGAKTPCEVGYYFWWGDTVGHRRENSQKMASDGSVSGYSFSESNTPTCRKGNTALQNDDLVTADGNLTPEHDAAHIYWKRDWRMPTEDEMQELVDNTETEWTTKNGVGGMLVKGKGAYSSASIFLPAAGYYDDGEVFYNFGKTGNYWSSSPHSSHPAYASRLWFNAGFFVRNDALRGYGQSVRPVRPHHKGVQLWENGPYWAETNIGAEKPEDYGYYFWWGDTKGYKRANDQWVASDGSVSGYEFNESNTPTYGKDNATLRNEGWITAYRNLAPAHDAAQVHWGHGWRMPTDAESDELISNTTTEWTKVNGVSGRLVKGKGAYSSASIFLPAAGYGYGGNLDDSGSYGHYWSSTSDLDYWDRAWNFTFNFTISPCLGLDNYYRYLGQPVRPLRGFSDSAEGSHYSVRFHACGGKGTMAAMNLVFGDAPEFLPECAFTKDGFEFVGWATQEGGTAVVIDRDNVLNFYSGDGTVIDLYAVWRTEGTELGGHKGVQLWAGGPYWAETNVGAEKPEDAGYYFWWGDTKGYKRENDQCVASDGSISGYSFSEHNTPTLGKDNATLQNEGWITADGNLVPAHDAAQAHWGHGWRMPTYAEFGELISNTTTEWTTWNGVNGRLVKGKGAYSSASIFLPAAGNAYRKDFSSSGSEGNYWSSTPERGASDYAWYLSFDSGSFGPIDFFRMFGKSVRPVSDSAE